MAKPRDKNVKLPYGPKIVTAAEYMTWGLRVRVPIIERGIRISKNWKRIHQPLLRNKRKTTCPKTVKNRNFAEVARVSACMGSDFATAPSTALSQGCAARPRRARGTMSSRGAGASKLAISPPRTNRFKPSEQCKFGESSQDYCLGSFLHVYTRDLPDKIKRIHQPHATSLLSVEV